MGGRHGRSAEALVSCSQKGCTNPPTYTYDWPGDGEQRCCLRHSMAVKQMGEALGLHITLRFLGPLGEMTQAEQRFAHEALARLQKKPYEPPKATAHALSWDGELNRLELLALQEHLDAHGQFHGPAFRKWALMRIERCKKLLDSEMRGKLAAVGIESDPLWMLDDEPGAAARRCACVNNESMPDGFNRCRQCGGSRG